MLQTRPERWFCLSHNIIQQFSRDPRKERSSIYGWQRISPGASDVRHDPDRCGECMSDSHEHPFGPGMDPYVEDCMPGRVVWMPSHQPCDF